MELLLVSDRLPEDWRPPYPLHSSPYSRRIKEIIENLPEFRMLCIYIRIDHKKVNKLDMYVDLSTKGSSGKVILVSKNCHGKVNAITRYPFRIKKRLFRSPKIIWSNMIDNNYGEE